MYEAGVDNGNNKDKKTRRRGLNKEVSAQQIPNLPSHKAKEANCICGGSNQLPTGQNRDSGQWKCSCPTCGKQFYLMPEVRSKFNPLSVNIKYKWMETTSDSV